MTNKAVGLVYDVALKETVEKLLVKYGLSKSMLNYVGIGAAVVDGVAEMTPLAPDKKNEVLDNMIYIRELKDILASSIENQMAAYDTISSIAKDELLVFLDLVEVDERGVEWYRIGYKNLNGWVSSKYAKSLVGPVNEVPAEKISRYKEVAQYFDADDIGKAAKKIGLDQSYLPYGDEGPGVYYDESLRFGTVDAQYMTLTGPGYTIYGAAVGMKVEEARAKLEEAGMVFNWERENRVSYERPTPKDSKMYWAEQDSILYLEHENGIVYSLDWNAYSG